MTGMFSSLGGSRSSRNDASSAGTHHVHTCPIRLRAVWGPERQETAPTPYPLLAWQCKRDAARSPGVFAQNAKVRGGSAPALPLLACLPDLSPREHQETSTVGPAVTTVLELFGDYVFRPFPPLGIPTPRNRRMQLAIRALDQMVYRMIAERRMLQTDTGDLLSMLLLAEDEETGQGMNDRQVRDEILTLLLAGHETTANTLTWTWYLLSEYPEVERRLHAELNEVLGGRVPTVEDLPDLKYTRMVLEEALRLYPPAPLLSRKAIAADELQGYPIAANSMIMISPYATHRHPAFWEEPERFDPERFTPERSAARPAYAYFPFGGGPRICIGNHFAMMEAQLILSTVAQRYQLRLIPGHPVEPQMVVTLRPRYGLPMTIHATERAGSQQ